MNVLLHCIVGSISGHKIWQILNLADFESHELVMLQNGYSILNMSLVV